MCSEEIIKVLKNKEWIEKDFDNLEIGDIVRFYNPEGELIIRKSGISEIRKVPDYYKDDDADHSNPYNADVVMLSEILLLHKAKIFIKSLVGKYASTMGRYQFRRAYKNLYDYLKYMGIDDRKKDKPHIDYLNRKESAECEYFLRDCCFDEIDIFDLLEKYGLLADETLYQNID